MGLICWLKSGLPISAACTVAVAKLAAARPGMRMESKRMEIRNTGRKGSSRKRKVQGSKSIQSARRNLIKDVAAFRENAGIIGTFVSQAIWFRILSRDTTTKFLNPR